jgi:serine phosphatase RsbU (regulator of sigma subunit)
MFVDLVFLQPLVDKSLTEPANTEAALEGFLTKADDFSSIQDVAAELGRAIDRVSANGAVVALVAPQADGGIQVVSAATRYAGIEIGDRSAAILWLGDNEAPLWREELEGITDVGAIDTAELMDSLAAKVLVPLRHRGNLLGLVMSTSAQLRRHDQREFLAGLRTHATTALANTFLNVEAAGRDRLVKVFGRANEMQAALMPEELPVYRPQWQLRGLFRPVTDCGGDFWGWRELSDSKVLMVIADATGHGAGPAILSAVAKGTMDAHAQFKGENCDPGELLTVLNAAILRVGQRVLMMTAFAVIVDVKKREMVYANAGQNFPFIIRNNKLEAMVVRGDQLGAKENPTFTTEKKAINPGDKLLLYTDGIVEAGEPHSAPFGERRFRRLVQSLSKDSAADIPEKILTFVEDALDGAAIHDDVTMIAFEFVDKDEVVNDFDAIPATQLNGPGEALAAVTRTDPLARAAALPAIDPTMKVPQRPAPTLPKAPLSKAPLSKAPLSKAPLPKAPEKAAATSDLSKAPVVTFDSQAPAAKPLASKKAQTASKVPKSPKVPTAKANLETDETKETTIESGTGAAPTKPGGEAE